VIELRDCYEPLEDVESLVLLAGDYVRASDDLRPRVLETARSQSGERRARRRIWQSALFVLLLGLFVTTLCRQPASISAGGPFAEAAGAQLLSGSEAASRDTDLSWGIVDSFTELRRRQAELLRLAL
jgi:hypothetical protein